jgi:hypothetical protein
MVLCCYSSSQGSCLAAASDVTFMIKKLANWNPSYCSLGVVSFHGRCSRQTVQAPGLALCFLGVNQERGTRPLQVSVKHR